jgi:ABC-type sugar transport system permease subunit
LIGALISVAFTSPLFCELVDNYRDVYPDFRTLHVRSIYQSVTLICLTISVGIFLAHLCNIRRWWRAHFSLLSRILIAVNVVMGLSMISVGICAALWEDKLRRTSGVVRRGYLQHQAQMIFGELTYPRPGAAAAAAVNVLFCS